MLQLTRNLVDSEWDDKEFDDLGEYEQDRSFLYSQMIRYLLGVELSDQDPNAPEELRTKVRELIRPVVPKVADKHMREEYFRKLMLGTIQMQYKVCVDHFGDDYKSSDEAKRIIALLDRYKPAPKVDWMGYKTFVRHFVESHKKET